MYPPKRLTARGAKSCLMLRLSGVMLELFNEPAESLPSKSANG